RLLDDLDAGWEFSLDEEAAKTGRYEIVRTAEQLQDVLDQIRAAKTYCLDTETTALNPLDAELVGVALSVREEHAWYIPVGHTAVGAESQLPRQTVLTALRSLFEDASLSLIGQNLKYDILVLARHHAGLVSARSRHPA
ncbi:MAG: hypothetical protein J4F42_21945, partial [Desulfurellaceae bacterium]|nr:hypothetical protein [Desulfurellaceae bacterium]